MVNDIKKKMNGAINNNVIISIYKILGRNFFFSNVWILIFDARTRTFYFRNSYHFKSIMNAKQIKERSTSNHIRDLLNS